MLVGKRRTVIIVSAVAAVLALAAGGSAIALEVRVAAARHDDGDRTIRATLDSETVRLDLPTSGDTQHVAVWFHGQGADENARMNEPWLNTLRAEGWAVASSTFHRTPWGNAAGVRDTEALLSWVQAQTGQSPTLWVAGSMGASVSLNAITHGDIAPPTCWYGTMPVVDLTSVSAVPNADEEIAVAWPDGIPDGWNPIDEADALPGIRYRVLASPDDTWVPAVANGEALVNALAARGLDVELRTVQGEHGDPSHFDAADLDAFAESCG